MVCFSLPSMVGVLRPESRACPWERRVRLVGLPARSTQQHTASSVDSGKTGAVWGRSGVAQEKLLLDHGVGASAQRHAFTWDTRLAGTLLMKEEYKDKTECLLLLFPLKRKIMFASRKVRSKNVKRGSPHDIHEVL